MLHCPPPVLSSDPPPPQAIELTNERVRDILDGSSVLHMGWVCVRSTEQVSEYRGLYTPHRAVNRWGFCLSGGGVAQCSGFSPVVDDQLY